MTTISFKDRLAKFNEFWEELETGEELSQVSDKALRKVARFLPETLACPDITSTRIVYKDKTYSHGKMDKTTHEMVEPIKTFQRQIGQVELHYSENGTKCTQSGLDDDGLILKLVTERLGVVSTFIEKDSEIEKLKGEALNAYDRTIEAWAAAFDTQQKEASGHTERVTNLALELAREMGFPEEELVNIRRGALLHDIGKISIPDEIISKHGKLTEEEFDVVRRHPLFAKKWLSQLELLKPALQIPYYHHERWDGSGYPLGLKGEDIPLAARMFSVIDVWDALTSDRPYRRALSKEEALNLIISQSGSHFDPKVVEHFVKVLSNENLINAPHQLRIQAFGAEKVWLQNILITTGDWQVHAAKEMFFVFLAHPSGLTKEQVGLYMWPDASTEELDIKFKNTLYRLRSAVGKQVILLAEGMYRFNPMLEYAFDVEIFLTSIQRAAESDDPRQKIKHLSHAIQQYSGDYLPEVDDYWAIPDREKYRQMYIDALYAIANLYFEREIYKSALRYCHQALEEDNANEEVHRLAMKIHAVTGNKAEIIRQYEACRLELEEKYDVEPSDQTQLLYDTLINA